MVKFKRGGPGCAGLAELGRPGLSMSIEEQGHRMENRLDHLLKDIRESVLPSGIRLLVRSRRKSPSATFQVWYRVGSRNEEIGLTGISHLLEHMMFKGTDRVGPEEFSRLIQREGGQTNAFTGRDVTAYYVIMSADRIPLALELEHDRMSNLKLRSKDFDSERMVAMEERRLRTETQPEGLLLEEVEALAFVNHPYRWPVIGWMEDIQRLRLSDLRRYRKTHYVPPNIVMVAVGDFDPSQMTDLLAEHFGRLPAGRPKASLEVVEGPQHSERRLTLRREAQVPFLVMAFHAPRVGHPDAYALEVVAAILAGGRSARLHRRLVREESLALDVGAHYSLLSLDPGLFTITARILPKRSIEASEGVIGEELHRLMNGHLTAQELTRAQGQLEAHLVFLLDGLLHQAMLMAQYEIVGGWRLLGEYLPGIRSVTLEDIQRVVKTYFGEDNRTVGWLIPRAEAAI